MTLADELLHVLATWSPLEATYAGIPGYDHELPDPSEPGHARLRAEAAGILDRARAATDPDRVTLGVVVQQAEALITRIDTRLVECTLADPLYAAGMSHLAFLPQLEPAGAQAEEDFLTRLAAFPAFYGALAERQRGGRPPVDRMARNAIGFLDRFLALDTPFPQELGARRDELVDGAVRPSLARYREFLATEVAGRGRSDEESGLCWLEDGEADYAALVRMHTTTGHTPAELHQLGRDVLAELDAEYAELGGRVFGLTDPAEVRRRLRSDESLRWRDAEEMLETARNAVARATAAAPGWFPRVPKAECVVKKVPDAEAPVAAAAYYMPPAPDGSRPGVYFTNTHDVHTRDRFIAETVAFHEAVPGHHFAESLALELPGLPRLRRIALVTAYDEGWALYTERLAAEMGLFSSDLMRLGMVAEESVRAARLVADTGLNALRWTREQCTAFLRAHTVLSEVEVQSEADRYVEEPGQALAYLTGRREIQRLRRFAEETLGDGFDLKEFHGVVLGSGKLPLTVLDDVVRGWVGRAKV
ncbi:MULTISPECIES: DUF885 domain-containing protein [unclassified Amycolatopsis]|uniref:DUF885 domain-containing protein n=1 Tax=unclassified Amycolatopsis TaxID=2618356 RepID=UPI0028757B61|nr:MULTISPECIES: DUF885 domain-containing protein [unclassified Amycolatopsis]MDS0132098.1 DUF885 domain-containing protein [Amycolatopsis sp. 505]MDS0141164.1 DUF885 domain-containing protein [Amycolatopsis sp. CM201R]